MVINYKYLFTTKYMRYKLACTPASFTIVIDANLIISELGHPSLGHNISHSIGDVAVI